MTTPTFADQMSAVLDAMFEMSGQDCGGAILVHSVECVDFQNNCTCEPQTLSVPSEVPCSA